MQNMPSRLPSLLCGALLGLAAPLAAQKQKVFVAPGNDNIISTTDQRRDDPPEHLIYVENHSSVPVTVWSVSLTRCENIKQWCEPKKVNIKVRPGGRSLAMRVNPKNEDQGFRYYFGFAWRPDSSNAAAIAAALGEAPATPAGAPVTLRYRELYEKDFRALGPRIASLRAEPESLQLAPGEQVRFDQVPVLVVDLDGKVLGRTQWLQFSATGRGVITVQPPDGFVARSPGRGRLMFRLADAAQQLVGHEVAALEVPVVVAYRVEANAPVFLGRAIDADTKQPLACAAVTLMDSVQNVVASGRTLTNGAFTLRAPHTGSYSVAVSIAGWAAAQTPPTVAGPNEEKQGEYAVRFEDELLAEPFDPDVEHAHAVAVRGASSPPAPGTARKGQPAPPVVSRVTLGGSPTRPVLGIVSNAPSATTWVQFAVDTTGTLDSMSVVTPPDLAPRTRAAVMSIVPRLRFAPARENGRPVCELLRMQVVAATR